ncbi:MAG TPA: class I SAM-dependent methyltransferase [Candidatus Dormibacteraeota bacterium]
MDLHTYQILYDTEATHWWLAARRNIVLDSIRQRYSTRTDLQILDAGCGTGLMLQELAPFGTVEGVDISDEALQFCRKRGLDNVRHADVTQLPFPDEQFDVVTALDVLEHLDDDTAAMREFRRVLKPGGRVFVFAPAHRWLWSLQDEVSHHKRRYVRRTLSDVVMDAGLEIERQTYVSTFLLPVIYLGRQWLKVRMKFQELNTENNLHPAWSNTILRNVFESEIRILRFMNMPFGASLLCVARKAG